MAKKEVEIEEIRKQEQQRGKRRGVPSDPELIRRRREVQEAIKEFVTRGDVEGFLKLLKEVPDPKRDVRQLAGLFWKLVREYEKQRGGR